MKKYEGLKLDEGAYDSREGETEIKQLMISRGQKTIMMADHTKFDRTSFVKYCSFQQIDILVTDRRPADEWMELLEEYQIRILYPEAEDAYIKETGNS